MAEHLITDCPALSGRRTRHLGKAILVPSEVKEMDPKKVASFQEACGWIGNDKTRA